MKQYAFHVTGMHCNSCKLIIEDMLSENEGIRNPRVDLKAKQVILESSETDEPSLVERLNSVVQSHGYVISSEKPETKKEDSDNLIWQAIPIGLVVLAAFFFVQKTGILNLWIGGTVTPATSFVIGLVASVSSCLAIVGGLVLSLSAKVAQDEGKSSKKTFALFHAGRLVGFALFGGLLGLVGQTLGVSYVLSSALGLLAAAIMIVLGLNLTGILKRNVFTLPAGVFRFFKKMENKPFAPIAIGAWTFFLPCWFTQSMQVVALSSSSFVGGATIMLSFALGTLPVLALLSFGSASFAQSKHAPLFFKSAGVIVIGLGLFALIAGLVGLGIIPPIFYI